MRISIVDMMAARSRLGQNARPMRELATHRPAVPPAELLSAARRKDTARVAPVGNDDSDGWLDWPADESAEPAF